ncbi:MAG: hypothetical protein DRO88_01610 [Promethearchaeia archaeon]|nr:MAG: hypothetical protein DRO88_01610 [Candidatus Lokiarchaeia archaeon]
MQSTSQRNFIKSITNFLTGKSHKHTYGIFLFILLIILLCSYGYALWSFPGQYQFLRMSVSSLGNTLKNPIGHYFWRFGMVVAGIGIIPYIFFLFQQLRSIARITTYIFTIILIFSAIGVIGVGIFSEDSGIIHYLFAGLAFFGFFTAFSFNMYTLIKTIKDGKGWIKIWQLVLIYLIADLVMLGFLTAFTFYWLYYFWKIFIFMMYLPLWEWLLLGSYIFYLYAIYLIFPKNSLN